MVIQFLILGIGHIFVNRTIKFQINRKPLSKAILTRIKKIHLHFFLILTILSTCFHPSIIIFFILFFIFLIFYVEKLQYFVLRQNFQQFWIQFLDELLLLMMTGRSFRDSFLFITSNSQNFFHKNLRELLFINDFSKNFKIKNETRVNSDKNLFKQSNLAIIYELVQSIEQNPHKAIDKIKAHRRQLRCFLYFKNKSKQATLLMRTQAFILSLLYIGLLIFIFINQNGFLNIKSLLPSVFISLGLFSFGIILMLFIGRKKTWKT